MQRMAQILQAGLRKLQTSQDALSIFRPLFLNQVLPPPFRRALAPSAPVDAALVFFLSRDTRAIKAWIHSLQQVFRSVAPVAAFHVQHSRERALCVAPLDDELPGWRLGDWPLLHRYLCRVRPEAVPAAGIVFALHNAALPHTRMQDVLLQFRTALALDEEQERPPANAFLLNKENDDHGAASAQARMQ
jgi:hypothetical protein